MRAPAIRLAPAATPVKTDSLRKVLLFTVDLLHLFVSSSIRVIYSGWVFSFRHQYYLIMFMSFFKVNKKVKIVSNFVENFK